MLARRWIVALALLSLVGCKLGSYEAQETDAAPPGTPDAAQETPLQGACSLPCHGHQTETAPPLDTAGTESTSNRGVGAHRSHLADSDWRRKIECSECHVVPTDVGSPGHIDSDLPAELITEGFLANTTWDGLKCSNNYCHGSALSGGVKTEPEWTVVDGSASGCGSCHGVPPPSPHPSDPECGNCHPSMNPGDGLLIAYPALHIDGKLDVIEAAPCDSCHGSSGIAAPPRDVNGGTSNSLRSVGAHREHLGLSSWHKQLDCVECHKVPASISDLGHTDSDLPAELTFGPLAGAASWNGTACSNSYCHGSTLTGGSARTPVWTQIDGTQIQCGSCHGAPPPAPHPVGDDCSSCHPTMVAGSGLTIAYPELHIDGKVDVTDDQPCDSCHGSGGIAAPPVDTSGNTSTTERSVGAHRRHLDPSSWRRTIECAECHRVPGATLAVGHIDSDLPAELTFGSLAGSASWNGSTCSNTYCHGSTLTGGTSTNPIWTQVDGAQGQCGSCHGAPPPPPHPVNADCGQCHDTMMAGAGLVIDDPARHIDGNLDVVGDPPCDSCHGGGGNDAPPTDTLGNTATTARGVGAHRNHLRAASWYKPVECSACHNVPGSLGSIGHVDSPLPAEVVFSSLAGTNAQWSGATCANSYCHGSSLSGGTATTPRWTLVDGTQTQCGSCHGAPPPPPHTSNADCGVCHASMTPGGGLVITNAALHINGNLEVSDDAACDSCHGGGGDPSPPVDIGGSSSTASRGVGAHQSHLQSSSWRKQIACAECHRVPASNSAVGHMDTPLPAELTFGSLGLGTDWSGSTCSNSYCHGSTLAGGSATTPVWTTVDGSQSECGSCHGLPPPPPHPTDAACENCHGEVVGPGLAITSPAKHIDGTLQVSAVHPPGWAEPTQHGYDFNTNGPGSCATAGCHGTTLTGGASNVSCEGCHSGWKTTCDFCHGGTNNSTGAPPASVFGLTSRTAPEVGAHTAHVSAGATHAAYACTRCHVMPSSALSPSHIDGNGAEVLFSSLNPAGVYNGSGCSTMYCHGNGRTNNGSIAWTGDPTLSCASCHPAMNSGSNAWETMSGDHKKHLVESGVDCGDCHASVTGTAGTDIIAPNQHVDGSKQIVLGAGIGMTWNPTAKTCVGSCHGEDHDSGDRW